MAEKKTNKAPETNEREEILIPRSGPKTEQQLMIGINGVNYVIPKGQRVSVPRFVAEEIRRSMAASDKMFKNKEDLIQTDDGALSVIG